MPQGTIKKLVSERGFGFIKGERDELFFHNSEVEGGAFDSLREGQTVDYQKRSQPPRLKRRPNRCF